MFANEIKIDQQELNKALWVLKQLGEGTSFVDRNPDWFLLSISSTADEAVELYRSLQDAERALVSAVNRTVKALELAGVSFAEADNAAAADFRELPFAALR